MGERCVGAWVCNGQVFEASDRTLRYDSHDAGYYRQYLTCGSVKLFCQDRKQKLIPSDLATMTPILGTPVLVTDNNVDHVDPSLANHCQIR